jgi:hypothetical protein
MPTFTANSTQTGQAYTNTNPSFLVTSTSAATATSNLSQENAQNVANSTAKQVANSVAQNDANIITQTLNLTTANYKGQFSYLNFYEAVPTDVGSNATFTGVLVNPNQTDNPDTNSLIINYEKDIYYTNTLNPTQPAPTQIISSKGLTGFYNLTYKNNTSGSGSLLNGQRTTYKKLTLNGYIYNIIVSVSVTINCSQTITSNTKKSDLDDTFTSITINNKMSQGISTYTPSGNFDKYAGVVLTEDYSPDGNWNYLYINFDNASISGSSTNIYPYNIAN